MTITQETAKELLRQLKAVVTQIIAQGGITPPGIQAAIDKAEQDLTRNL